MPEEKICTKCKIKKPITEFGKAVMASDGKSWHCKKCVAETATKKRNEIAEGRKMIF